MTDSYRSGSSIRAVHDDGVGVSSGARLADHETGSRPNGFTVGTFSLAGASVVMLAVLAACGGAEGPGGERGPVIGSRPQSLQFAEAPSLQPGGTAKVSATASSGLAVRYNSSTTGVCTVDADSGEVTARAAGNCVIAASQAGDTTWASASAQQQITVQSNVQFGAVPSMTVGDSATVTVSASSDRPMRYSSLTETVCRADADSGLVTALAAGTCTVAAEPRDAASGQTGTRLTQSFEIAAAGAVTVPLAPEKVTARRGTQDGTVLVTAGHVRGGGVVASGYTVTSVPAGITVQAQTLPVTVPCPASGCTGHAFALSVTNAAGTGPASEPADVISRYTVVAKFREPDYAHDMTEFHGSFRYNATRMTVSDLSGELSEVMAGNNQPNQPWPDGMPLLSLRHQLSSIAAPAGDGLLVTSFLLEHTNTLSDDPRDAGTDGWTPGTGGWKYWGYHHGERRASNPGNAYARIFVNTKDPLLPLTQAQIDTLAYADCHAEGMMGDDCMTGTTVAGYGTRGSMRGYPVSQEVKLADTP